MLGNAFEIQVGHKLVFNDQSTMTVISGRKICQNTHFTENNHTQKLDGYREATS